MKSAGVPLLFLLLFPSFTLLLFYSFTFTSILHCGSLCPPISFLYRLQRLRMYPFGLMLAFSSMFCGIFFVCVLENTYLCKIKVI